MHKYVLFKLFWLIIILNACVTTHRSYLKFYRSVAIDSQTKSLYGTQRHKDADSPFLGKTMKEAGFRDKYHCFIAGVERAGDTLRTPNPHEPFANGDVLWVVGESRDVYKLVGLSEEEYED